MSCNAIVHIQDALNGKEVDWHALFCEYIKLELILLKEALYKKKGNNIRTLVGPPFTVLLTTNGFLTVQQEIEVGMLVDFIEKPISKKRKIQPSMELTTGETSKTKEPPQILVAIAGPTMAKPIPTPNIIIDLGNPLHAKPNSSQKQEIPKTFTATINLHQTRVCL